MRVEDGLLFVTKVERIPMPFRSDDAWSGDVYVVAERLRSMVVVPGVEAKIESLERYLGDRAWPVCRVECVLNVSDKRCPEVGDRVNLAFEVVDRNGQGGSGEGTTEDAG